MLSSNQVSERDVATLASQINLANQKVLGIDIDFDKNSEIKVFAYMYLYKNIVCSDREKVFPSFYSILVGKSGVLEKWFLRFFLFNSFLDNFYFLNKDYLIHYSASFRNFCHFCSRFSIRLKRESRVLDFHLRKRFEQFLIENEVTKVRAMEIAQIYPTSHLENFSIIYAKAMDIKIPRVVAATVFGFLEDPLLSLATKIKNCDVFYIQHGGEYGLGNQSLIHKIEESGCKKFIYWGFGQTSVRQTRYRRYPKIFGPFARYDIIFCDSISWPSEGFRSQNIGYLLSHFDNGYFGFHPERTAAIVSGFWPQRKIGKGVRRTECFYASVVIFCDPSPSLLYQRLAFRKPFLILIDRSTDAQLVGDGVMWDLLEKCGCLVGSDELTRFCIECGFNTRTIAQELDRKQQPLFDWYDDLPRLEELLRE